MLVISANNVTTNIIIFQILCVFANIKDKQVNIVATAPKNKLGTPKYAMKIISPSVVPNISSVSAVKKELATITQNIVKIKQMILVTIPIIHNTLLVFSFLRVLVSYAISILASFFKL